MPSDIGSIMNATHQRLCSSVVVFMIAIGLFTSSPSAAQAKDRRSEQITAPLEGFRYGLSVTDLDGDVVLEHRADERFMPASNAKLFTTAAVLNAEAKLETLNASTQVFLETASSGPSNLVLIGRGDPTVGFGEDCEESCLETLAERVAASGLREVGDIIGDDQWFADEPTPVGWSWEDLKFGFGTSISALAVNDNVASLKVEPATDVGKKVTAYWAMPYTSSHERFVSDPPPFALQNDARTEEVGSLWALRLERGLGGTQARLYGELPRDSRPTTLNLGVDNPAHLAASQFKHALQRQGITVSGVIRTRHRPLNYSDELKPSHPNRSDSPQMCVHSPAQPSPGRLIASLPSAPITKIVTRINRDSQNLYAEVMLRQLGRVAGNGASFCGRLQIENMLTDIGIDPSAFEIVDGSGLSNYNRATPAALTTVLQYAARASWAQDFKDSLAVAGATRGTLRRRFRDTPLDGKLFAKTGSLNHVNALSGYLETRSGKTLAFSILVNDRPLDGPSATAAIDAALIELAKRY